MSSAVICSMPAEGHVRPLLVVARALRERGWRVRFLTGQRYEPLVTAAGIEFAALPAEADTLDAIGAETDRDRGLASINRGIERAFLAPAPAAGRALLDLVGQAPADLVIHEPTFVGVQVLYALPERERPLTVLCGLGPLGLSSRETPPYGLGLQPLARPRLNRLRNRLVGAFATKVVLRPVHRAADRMLAHMGAPRVEGGFFMDLLSRADLLAQFTVPGFEFPRPDAPTKLRFYGPMTRSMRGGVEAPAWFAELDGRRPVVHVTQGTVANVDLDELVGPTIRALADQDVTVVVTTGGRPLTDLDALGPLPANVRAAEFLPYDELLPRTDVLVTNGGYGGLHHAMEHGVPIVVAGDSEDKVETSTRVAWSGVGISLRTGRPTADAVRSAVRTILDDPAYAAASRRLGDDIADSRGPGGLLDDIDELLTARGPRPSPV
ncbi:glycosyltransferase [Nocardioides lijunqiniae]|uniref:glycosyltransferase n=1 Tax=Nocardioides lijunqiniae TaxID=2760832 RepID=UPI00187798A2|nr:glycosyltransferase [Nocardioides lijunqiniae]